jgi:hypothetical protein
MKEHEKMQSLESGRIYDPVPTVSEGGLTPARIERLMADRTAMLSSVERLLTVRSRERLGQKLDQERKKLFELADFEKRTCLAAKKMIQVLNRTYFSQKPLDPELF